MFIEGGEVFFVCYPIHDGNMSKSKVAPYAFAIEIAFRKLLIKIHWWLLEIVYLCEPLKTPHSWQIFE